MSRSRVGSEPEKPLRHITEDGMTVEENHDAEALEILRSKWGFGEVLEHQRDEVFQRTEHAVDTGKPEHIDFDWTGPDDDPYEGVHGLKR